MSTNDPRHATRAPDPATQSVPSGAAGHGAAGPAPQAPKPVPVDAVSHSPAAVPPDVAELAPARKAPSAIEQLRRHYTIKDPEAVQDFLDDNPGIHIPLCRIAPGLLKSDHVLSLGLEIYEYHDSYAVDLEIMVKSDLGARDDKCDLAIKLAEEFLDGLPRRFDDQLMIDVE